MASRHERRPQKHRLGTPRRPWLAPAPFSLPHCCAHPDNGLSSVASSESCHAATAPPDDEVSSVPLLGSHATPVMGKDPLTASETD